MKDLETVLVEVRKKIKTAMIQCHDCRMLRDSLVSIIDSVIIPDEDENKSIETITPLVRAHSNVIMREQVSRAEPKDEVTIDQTMDRRV